jgi:hypothetical protein
MSTRPLNAWFVRQSALLLLAFSSLLLQADDATKAGRFHVEHPLFSTLALNGPLKATKIAMRPLLLNFDLLAH